VLDARASQRFSGEMETLDSRAGHIPGSLNRPFGANLQAGGRFKEPGQLREEFQALLGSRDPASVAHSCGSGVTACHNLFAMELAGLRGTRLYPGSWSEWIRDPGRPIETGA
jgi:thiosulfate/3-mercaptopyruvate sulfurtransferase